MSWTSLNGIDVACPCRRFAANSASATRTEGLDGARNRTLMKMLKQRLSGTMVEMDAGCSADAL